MGDRTQPSVYKFGKDVKWSRTSDRQKTIAQEISKFIQLHAQLNLL